MKRTNEALLQRADALGRLEYRMPGGEWLDAGPYALQNRIRELFRGNGHERQAKMRLWRRLRELERKGITRNAAGVEFRCTESDV